MDLVFTDQLLKTQQLIQSKPTQPTVCAQSPTGHLQGCDPHKFPISSLAQFSPRKAQV